jgi:hypothetical protein
MEDGTTDSNHWHALRLNYDIGACLNQYLWDLYEHHGATQYSAPSTPLLDVRPSTGTRIKISVTSFLAPTIER